MAEIDTPILECQQVTAAYGRLTALHGVSLRVQEKEIVAVIGANGAGKTTLMRVIMGFLRPTGGSVRHRGSALHRVRPHHMARRRVAYVPEGRELFSSLSVMDNLRLGLTRQGGAARPSDLDEVLAAFPVLIDRRNQAAGTLSGGEQQMVAMARAMASKPDLCLLDEPSLGLAPKMQEQVFEIIENIRSQGVSVLLVEQNARRALKIADRGYVLETGRTVAHGTGEELIQDPEIEAAYLGQRPERRATETTERSL